MDKDLKKLNWTWLRGLLKIVEEVENINDVVQKVETSFIDYLSFYTAKIFIVENSENEPDIKEYADKLSSANFFSRDVIEEIFLHKQPFKKSSREIVFPLESDDMVHGLFYIESNADIDSQAYQLLWSFTDQLSIIIHNLQMPNSSSFESKKEVKKISNSIFNNLKGFLEASLERLKVLEEQNIQLVELNKTRTELINNVSHELRTPLVSIMGFSNILQRHEIKAELIKEASEQIQAAGSRLSRMIDDLIQLNRASTKGWDINFERLDIGEITKFVIDTLRPLNQDHSFILDLPEEYPLIQGDRKLMRQVIENLMINAVKYSPEGGEIKSSLKFEDELIKLTVRDQGIGMTEEENSRIFDRFYRAKNPKTENISGLGLGLTICRDIVTAMNGSIDCESEFGEGSSFTISFNIG